MRVSTSIFTLLGYTLSVFAAGGRGSAAKCKDFKLHLPNVLLNGTTHFPENSTVSLSTPQSSIFATDLPAFCRLQIVITTNTTASSTALVEVWLPDEWNGRLLGTGNGGFSGGSESAFYFVAHVCFRDRYESSYHCPVNVGDLGNIAVKRGCEPSYSSAMTSCRLTTSLQSQECPPILVMKVQHLTAPGAARTMTYVDGCVLFALVSSLTRR